MGGIDPTGFYSGLRDNVAYNLLKQFGFPAAIQVKSGEVFDPLSGTITAPATWFVFPCVALYGGTGSVGGVKTETEGKTLNRIITKEVNLDATVLTIQPTTDDLFQDENGATFEILSVLPVNPGGLTVMWKIKTKR